MIDGKELLEALETLRADKKIDKEIIFEGIKEGFQRAYEKHFDPEAIVRVDIDQNMGQIKVFKELTVVKKIEDEWLDILLDEAKAKYGDVTIGDTVYEPVEFTEKFSKTASLQVAQIIKQKIREAEKDVVFKEFEPLNQTIVGGVVRDITDTMFFIEVNGVILPLWIKKIIPGEDINEGDRISLFIEEVSKENKHSQVQGSRIHPKFLEKLMEVEVPEIQEGVVEIKACSREPGIRAKVAVVSHDSNVDPIGACVGNMGSRIKVVTEELKGEKIDVILWKEDKTEFIINALSPVKTISIEVDLETNEATVIVPTEQISLAIGKRGMAARLVANLVGMKINIFSFDQANEQGIKIHWNGNLTEDELISKSFLNNRRNGKF
ncbi:transcription termination factor NusA [Spiroplasma endosymbiont of Othius punctulatus]|uniref:transcription termination factor NusA n=1 Tax=Spiroplasma endosymbiont of Othius punctulatus TaxID=3066289 RepID=UPI0030D43F72